MENGQIDDLEVAVDSYLDHVLERFGADLDGLRHRRRLRERRVLVDRAARLRGARRRGDARSAIDPDGTNINVGCGATDLRALQQLVRRGAARPRRRIRRRRRPDARGRRERRGARRRPDPRRPRARPGVDTVAVTTMTNLGFHRLMDERGIRVLTTDVGDRYVLEALQARGRPARRRAVGPHHLPRRPRHRRRARGRAASLRRAPGPDARRGGGGDGALPAGEAERRRRRGARSSDAVRHEVDRLNAELAGVVACWCGPPAQSP